jgi:hypothetical protein
MNAPRDWLNAKTEPLKIRAARRGAMLTWDECTGDWPKRKTQSPRIRAPGAQSARMDAPRDWPKQKTASQIRAAPEVHDLDECTA